LCYTLRAGSGCHCSVLQALRPRRRDAKPQRIKAEAVYAAIHQFGGVIKAKNVPYLRFKVGDRWASKKQVTIPARPFFPVNDAGTALTPPAEALVKSAAERALKRLVSAP
jgi:phage gpG-like protein